MASEPASGATHLPSVAQRLRSLLRLGFFMLLVAVGVVLWLADERLRAGASREQQWLAADLGRHLDALIRRSFQEVRILATELPALDASATGRLHARRFDSALAGSFLLVAADGTLLAADPPTAGPFPSAASLAAVESVTGLYERPAAGLRLALVQPVRREARLVAWLLNEVDPDRGPLVDELRTATERGLAAAVVDASGEVVLAPERSWLRRRLVAEPAGAAAVTLARGACTLCPGGPTAGHVITLARLELAPWRVLVEQPRDHAAAAFRPVRYGFLGVGALVVLTGALLARALSRSLVVPLESLVAQAERLHQDLHSPIAVAGDREVVQLAEALDGARVRLAHTLADLEQLAGTLEAQVVERTAELQAAMQRGAELLERTLAQDAERRRLVGQLLAAGEEERRRIARELHDEISQLLTVIALALERAREDPAAMARAGEALTRAQQELHRLIYDLRPSLLDDLGLAAAVGWYARNYLAPKGIEVSVEVEEELVLPGEVEISAFRIYQEIVTNLLRHAEAENVAIALFVEGTGAGRRLVLEVEDDGRGFDPTARADGAGLIGMRERAALVGGTLTIDSEPGAGTRVRLEVPLHDVPSP